MDDHPPEHPQPGPPPSGADPAFQPAPWPSEPQSPPYPPPQNFSPAFPPPGVYPGPDDGGAPLVAPPAPSVPPEPWVEPGDARAAVLLAGLLVVLGILAGVLWSAISPHAQGIVVTKTQIIPVEQENWIAADGRFAIITAVIGLIVGASAWFWRARRGPVLAAGLAIGAGLGALLTALVGYWLSSGHDSGAVNTEIRLRVHVHAHGLIALEAVLALAAYLVSVLFSGPDDLGRSSPPVAESGVPVGVTCRAG